MTHILYGAPPSLYSGKARAYLDWKQIDYREERPSPEIMMGKIVPTIGYPVVPVLETADGTLIQDTTVIIDHFEDQMGGPSIYPGSPKQRLAALLFELYGDEWLVIPAMHYRWNFNEEWIYGEFGLSALPDGTPEQRYEAGKAMGQRFKGFVPMLGIDETTIPAIEKSYATLLADLDTHFADHQYLLGSRPSVGDYGLIGPLYAHLYRDPESGKLMKRLAPNVARWVERMVTVEQPLAGEFLPGDTVPSTLFPVLQRMMIEQLPNLQATAYLLRDWAEENGDAELPRAVGMAPYAIEGVEGARMASVFSLWMLERPLDYYRGLAGESKTAADQLLSQIGGTAFSEFDLPQRVKFEDYRVSLD